MGDRLRRTAPARFVYRTAQRIREAWRDERRYCGCGNPSGTCFYAD